MKYIQQSSSSIRLYFSEGKSNIEQFRILQSSEIKVDNISIVFGILGESHFIQIIQNNKVRTEICACVEGVFSDSDKIVFNSKLTLLQNSTYSNSKNSYNFDFKTYIGKIGETKANRLLKSGNTVGTHLLVHKFPGKHWFSKKALTVIKIKVSSTQIQTETVHTYPDEKKYVFTNSIFTL